jgi:thiamine pyrophosphate-dependent acetolactate synthase large subunit-like protein
MTALRDNSPVVALTGQSSSAVIGTEAFQEVDITGITLPVCKHNYLVTNILDLPRVLKEAFLIARTGRSGPVVVSVAADVQSANMDYAYPENVDLPGYRTTVGEAQSDAMHQAKVHEAEQQRLRNPPLHDAALRETSATVESHVALQVRRVTQGRALMVSDLGQDPEHHRPESMVGSGTRGSALPAAIGMQLGHPDENVWVIEGAHSFEMNIQELATVVQERLPIKMVILGGESLILRGQRLHEQPGDQCTGSSQLVPGLAKIAGAYGIQSLTVRDGSEVRAAIEQAAASRGPMLLDMRYAHLRIHKS